MGLLKEKKKTLVFSNYVNSLVNLEETLVSHNIPYGRVKGTGATITAVINKFKNGKLDVLLLNSAYHGAGHNLQETERIIIMHHLGSNLYTQVVGRAQRLGRTSSLEVVSLLYPNEEITGNS
tara:strand:- start:20 stop:385 length:366 start_codon:yes stop_codon:yes gene_type:complete